MLKGVTSGNVVDEQRSCRPSIVGPGDAPEGLLSGRVPNLQLDLRRLVDTDHAGTELHANRQIVHGLEAFVRKLKQQARFTDSY